MAIELSEEELNNYGVIISHSDNYKYDELKIDETSKVTLKGVRYIYNNLIKPLQTNIISKFQYVTSREIVSKKIKKEDRLKSDTELFEKMIKRSDETKYNLYALRMNDFDELLKYLTRSNKSVFFIKSCYKT